MLHIAEATQPLFLRRREAARLLSISTGSLDALIRRKAIPVIRPSRRMVLIRRSALEAALEKFEVKATGAELSLRGRRRRTAPEEKVMPSPRGTALVGGVN